MEILLTLLAFLGVVRPSVAASHVIIFALEGGSTTFERVQRNLITEFDDIGFKMNTSYNIMSFFPPDALIIEHGYKGRLIFNTTTFSLELRNLQKNDSGLYKCEIRWDENITNFMYKLFVIEPVAAPTLTLVSNWSSSDSCNVTVTCRGHDLSQTFSCNSSGCTQLEDVPATPTLVVYIRDGYIVCNHSNKVSWCNVTLDMSSVCKSEHGSRLWILLTVGIMSAAIAAAFTMMIACQNRKLRSTGTDLNKYASARYSLRPEVPERTAACREQDEGAKAVNSLMPEPQSEPVVYSLLQLPRPEIIDY